MFFGFGDYKGLKLGDFAVERVISLSTGDKLDASSTATANKGIRLVIGLHDNQDFGNHHLWSADKTKEEKLAELQKMFHGHKTGEQATAYALTHKGLSALGITDVRIKEIDFDFMPSGSKSWIMVTLNLEWVIDKQDERENKQQPVLKDGASKADTPAAATQASKQGAVELSFFDKLLKGADDVAGSLNNSLGMGG